MKIAYKDRRFLNLSQVPVFVYTETKTLIFDIKDHTTGDEYSLAIAQDFDVDTPPYIRVNGSVDTITKEVTFIIPFYGDGIKKAVNGQSKVVKLQIQLLRISSTGIHTVLLRDNMIALSAIDNGGLDIIPTPATQPANAHYTVEEFDEFLKELEKAAGNPPDNDSITKNASQELQAVGIKETNSSSTQKVWVGTYTQYVAQNTGLSNDICFITDDEPQE